MKEQDFYLTIAQTSVEEFKDKGSRFIAYAFPLQSKDAVKKILLELKIGMKMLLLQFLSRSKMQAVAP